MKKTFTELIGEKNNQCEMQQKNAAGKVFMKAICSRELRSWFQAPLGYVFVAAITTLYGFFYYQVMMSGSSSYVTAVYTMLFSFDMMLIPILTMRSLAEEKRNHTDQALLTAPVGVLEIVAGKFAACFVIFWIASTVGLLPAFAMKVFAQPPMGLILGNYVGTLCYGGAMIAIGIFISGLTSSQVVAAVATFAVSVFLMYMNSMAAAVNQPVLNWIVERVSFYSRYGMLIRGILSAESLVYFIGVCVIFLYLSALVLEAGRVGTFRFRSAMVGKAAALIAAVILINAITSLLSQRYPSMNADLTASGLNTLSQEEKDYLSTVDQEIRIYVIANEEKAREDQLYASYGISYSQVANLLDRMQEWNHYIQVQYVDTEENPGFLNSYSQEQLSDGSVLVQSSLRYRVLRIDDLFVSEQNTQTGTVSTYSQAGSSITNAIAYVSMEDVPVITVALGHGEILDSSTRAAFDSLMKENAFEIREINILTDTIPDDTSILFLPTPTTDYTEEEIQRLRSFMNDNDSTTARTLLFSAYPSQGNIPKLKQFLEDWGIRIDDGTIIETDESRMFLNDPASVFVRSTQTVLADGSYMYLVAPSSSPLEILFESNDGIYAFPLWETGDTCEVKGGKNSSGKQIAAAYVYRKNEKNAYRNVVVFGSSMSLASPYLDSNSFANASYVRDLLRVASNTKAFTAVQNEQILMNEMDITASRQTINIVGLWIFTILIPAGILIAGGIVFLRRRNQ